MFRTVYDVRSYIDFYRSTHGGDFPSKVQVTSEEMGNVLSSAEPFMSFKNDKHGDKLQVAGVPVVLWKM